MFLAYRQFKKYRARQSGATAGNADVAIVHMPQPTYAGAPMYPLNDANSTPDSSPKTVLRPPHISRTPSPTPSEIDFLNGVSQKRSLSQRIRTYIVIAIVIAVIALIESYHEQILNGLKPATSWLHRTKGAWLIPIAILIGMSFPPLFGHEIVAMVCGVTWGLGIGFGIVAAGTILGEICTFFVFKYTCSARARKAETTNMSYATLARVVRQGGLVIAIIMRYSTLPAHLTTALFATCGMQFWVFLVAAIISLPKQLVVVYIGTALESNSSTSNKVQRVVLGVTIVITIAAMFYIRRQREAAKPGVVYDRRKARQAMKPVEFV